MVRNDGGVFRIVVREGVVPLKWNQWRRLSGCKARTAKMLEQFALKEGSRIADWRATFDHVGAPSWLAVERWTKGRWDADEALLQAGRSAEATAAVLGVSVRLDDRELGASGGVHESRPETASGGASQAVPGAPGGVQQMVDW